MDIIYWVWFAQRAYFKNKYARELFEYFDKNPERIYNLSPEEIRELKIPDATLVGRLMDKNLDKETAIINKCAQNSYNILPYNHKNYPERLRNIPDYPYLLYHRGKHYNFTDSFAIALVGTRKSTGYGDQVAYELGRELAYNGALVVSGMALGIDGQAQRGAMSIDKPTVAVLGSGIDVIQPKRNKKIYEYMLTNGAVYSEYPPGTPGLPGHFPVRNRLISGLSVGVVVVEAEASSGSLHTADYALEQGKDLFAVPNSIKNPKGVGTNNLIKENAYIVTSVNDILDEYKGMFIEESQMKKFDEKEYNNEFMADYFIDGLENITPLEKEILNAIKKEALTTDSISEKTSLPVEKVMASMTMLEIKGAVKTAAGNKFALNIERNG